MQLLYCEKVEFCEGLLGAHDFCVYDKHERIFLFQEEFFPHSWPYIIPTELLNTGKKTKISSWIQPVNQTDFSIPVAYPHWQLDIFIWLQNRKAKKYSMIIE
jgi:hypothetical protein